MSSQPPSRIPLSIPLWALGFFTALFVVACGALWGFLLVARPTSDVRATPTAVFVVLTPENPPEVDPTATLFLVDTSTPELTPTIPPPLVEGTIQIGALVQIVNTGGDGLRLHVEPGLDTEVNYLALELEVLQVQDGPRDADDFTWWLLVAQADSVRNGWAAENWLQVVRGP